MNLKNKKTGVFLFIILLFVFITIFTTRADDNITMEGLTYKQSCLMKAQAENSKIDASLCGESWQETENNKKMFEIQKSENDKKILISIIIFTFFMVIFYCIRKKNNKITSEKIKKK